MHFCPANVPIEIKNEICEYCKFVYIFCSFHNLLRNLFADRESQSLK